MNFRFVPSLVVPDPTTVCSPFNTRPRSAPSRPGEYSDAAAVAAEKPQQLIVFYINCRKLLCNVCWLIMSVRPILCCRSFRPLAHFWATAEWQASINNVIVHDPSTAKRAASSWRREWSVWKSVVMLSASASIDNVQPRQCYTPIHTVHPHSGHNNCLLTMFLGWAVAGDGGRRDRWPL